MKKLLIALLIVLSLTISVSGADDGFCVYSAKRSGDTVEVRLNAPESVFLCVGVYDASTRQMRDIRTKEISAYERAQTATVRFDEPISNAEVVKAFLINPSGFVPLCEAMTAIIPEGELNFTFTLNTNTMKFHYSTCPSAKAISAKNRQFYYGTRESVLAMGYEPCNNCRP